MTEIYRDKDTLKREEELVQLYALTYPEEDAEFFRTRLRASAEGQGSLVLTMSRDGAAVGLLYGFDYLPSTWWAKQIQPYLPKEKNTFHRVFELNELLIHPAFRRQGLGRELMESLLRDFTYQGIMLGVKEENTSAIRLYSSLGFEILAEKVPLPGSSTRYLIMKYTV